MDEPDRKESGERYPVNNDRRDFTPPAGSQEGEIPPAQEAAFLNMRTLVFATLGLVGMILFVLLLAGALFGYFSFLEPLGIARPPEQSPPTAIPAGPPLQVEPGLDAGQIRATQQANLEGYGWVDRSNGVVRIPIEQAMELLVQRGLPLTDRETTSAVDEADSSGFGFATPQP
jgi:hypothetical protein